MEKPFHIHVGMTLFYRTKAGPRIYERIVKSISPSGNLLKFEEEGRKPGEERDIWVDRNDMEILDWMDNPKTA